MMLDTALLYASRNWPVFPLAPLSKVPPKGTHGRIDATTDESAIRQWFSSSEGLRTELDSNIGIDTDGAGLVVIDLDLHKEDADGYEAWDMLLWSNNVGTIKTYEVQTPTGGAHIYFKANPAIDVKSKPFASGIDVRAKNGSIVAAGSKTENGEYKCIRDVEPKPLPMWLQAALRKADAASSEQERLWRPSVLPQRDVTDAGKYVTAALDDELKQLKEAPSGGRNFALNKAAYKLSRFVAAGELDSHVVAGRLYDVAIQVGQDHREAVNTIASGMKPHASSWAASMKGLSA